MVLQNAQDWKSVTQVAHQDPKQQQELAKFVGVQTLGPRARKELEELKALAADLPPEV